MGDPETYRKRARECAVLAANSASPQHKTVWLELEQHWLHLACIYYQTERAVQALRYLGTDELEDLDSSGHSIH